MQTNKIRFEWFFFIFMSTGNCGPLFLSLHQREMIFMPRHRIVWVRWIYWSNRRGDSRIALYMVALCDRVRQQLVLHKASCAIAKNGLAAHPVWFGMSMCGLGGWWCFDRCCPRNLIIKLNYIVQFLLQKLQNWINLVTFKTSSQILTETI